MKAWYFKSNSISKPYVLQWVYNGKVYTDTFKTLKDLQEYAKAIGVNPVSID